MLALRAIHSIERYQASKQRDTWGHRQVWSLGLMAAMSEPQLTRKSTPRFFVLITRPTVLFAIRFVYVSVMNDTIIKQLE